MYYGKNVTKKDIVGVKKTKQAISKNLDDETKNYVI